jgi:hypothetical protein
LLSHHHRLSCCHITTLYLAATPPSILLLHHHLLFCCYITTFYSAATSPPSILLLHHHLLSCCYITTFYLAVTPLPSILLLHHHQGGFIPAALRGSSSDSFMHVSDWYATLSTLVGVDPTDIYNGHDVDSIDVWPMLTGTNATNPREYLPVTEVSIIWQGRYKYFSTTNSSFGSTNWQNTDASFNGTGGGCDRCLFDILADEEERVNIAAQHPDIVKQLAAQLDSYSWYTNASMTAEELAPYECAKLKNEDEQWPANWPWLVHSGISPARDQPARFDTHAKGDGVLCSKNETQASWPPGACNEVVLLRPSSTSGASTGKNFWVDVSQLSGNSPYIDIGFCSPRIPLNLSGTGAANWMGDQATASGSPLSWIYRKSGLFRVASAVHAKGRPYGAKYGQGSNISAVWHSSTSMEFAVDGVSQGRITLNASDAMPVDVVGCVGVCNGGAVDLRTPAKRNSHAFAGPCCQRRKAMKATP